MGQREEGHSRGEIVSMYERSGMYYSTVPGLGWH